ncbi:hypothetical protein D9M71_776120 [compost metagenome]
MWAWPIFWSAIQPTRAPKVSSKSPLLMSGVTVGACTLLPGAVARSSCRAGFCSKALNVVGAGLSAISSLLLAASSAPCAMAAVNAAGKGSALSAVDA